MNKTETEQLVKGLLKHSEPYRPEKQIAPEKPTVKRKTQRDKELRVCFRGRQRGLQGGWGHQK
ncbi:conserved protein of unknown function [Xenorhabdus poinarii G6]|uniref:Uncharacterized protein n=1 Tax=Xenorhabdus poinarii G6 TaxID=1354304 RepID=A0A068R089_9GAMM|nr:hypothetical protein [Xenorhabdus poinarii]CDG20608.1 conserved protein of unknown function [Xenorhabdus poinarii G6]